MARPAYFLGWWLWLGLGAAGPLMACRYSVRDTGFVDLGTASYRLGFTAASQLPPATRRAYEETAAAILPDSNITFSSPAEERPGDSPILMLTDADGHSLTLATGSALRSEPREIVRLLESAVTSPLREQLYKESLRSYGVLLLFEGSDAAANERARSAALAAIQSVSRLIPAMPKPVDVPPQLIAVPRAAQAVEAVLLWGLGFDPAPATDPRLAIVYGRGRRLGAPLEGPLITQTVLRERLVLIGQDCECDLDRAWLRGPLAPGRWDRSLQETAAKALGFDPENPVVRAEVSRIVERGPQPGQRRKTAGTAHALGYSEDSIADLPTVTATEDEEIPAPGKPTVDPGIPPAAAPTDGPTRRLWWLLGLTLGSALLTGGWLVIRAQSHR